MAHSRTPFGRGAWWIALGTAFALILGSAGLSPAAAECETEAGGPGACVGDWPVAGQNADNTRFASHEHEISSDNVGGLTPRWVFTTGGDVSATPTVADGVVYVPDWAGNLFAVEAESGRQVWSSQVAAYNGVAGSLSRTSPAVWGDEVVIGDQPGRALVWPEGQGAHIVAVGARSGKLRWKTQVDDFPGSVITSSPVVQDGVVYVGVSSDEEALAAQPGYPCCSFRGSEVALDAQTGRLLWKAYTVPPGYSGGAIWGSTAVPDPTRHSLFIATGNNYSVPPGVLTCEQAGGTSCAAKDDHFDSVMALDLGTGSVKWATGVQQFDTFTIACLTGSNPRACPLPKSPDYDFGSGPSLFRLTERGKPRDVLGIGQKSGVYWAFDPDTGAVQWATQVGAGGSLGGIQWGTAGDLERIYVAIADVFGAPYTLQPSGQTIRGGSWSALDASTGKILWQTADPLGAPDLGPVSVANGVVYGGSADPAGHMYALDAGSGRVLWSFASGGSVVSGAAIVGGAVYWGSGYSHLGPPGTANNKLYAFGLARAQAGESSSRRASR